MLCKQKSYACNCTNTVCAVRELNLRKFKRVYYRSPYIVCLLSRCDVRKAAQTLNRFEESDTFFLPVETSEAKKKCLQTLLKQSKQAQLSIIWVAAAFLIMTRGHYFLWLLVGSRLHHILTWVVVAPYLWLHQLTETML